MQHKYQNTLKDNGIKPEHLPASLQEMIKLMDSLEFELEDEDDEEEVKTIRSDIRQLDNQLDKAITDLLDDEVDEDMTEEEIKVSILSKMLAEGKTKTTLKELKNLNYPIASIGIRGEKVGAYNLTKGKYDTIFKIQRG
jgi:hypothetical protein